MITIKRKSGFLVYLDVDGQSYTVAATCECNALAFQVEDARREFDRAEERTVKLTCVLHGAIKTLAQHEQGYQKSNQEVFGLVETRFKRYHRVQWGKRTA